VKYRKKPVIINAEQYGLNWRNESVLLAIEFALTYGADYFYFSYKSELTSQPHANDSLSGNTAKAKLSPKLMSGTPIRYPIKKKSMA
jgi:hypothetical protein